MLATFRSTATESITMFHDVAVALLKMMGATGHVPGALDPEDVPAALARLEAAVAQLKAQPPQPQPANPAKDKDRDDEEEREPPVALHTRAFPLIGLLKRAAAANAEVMWTAGS